MVLLGEQHEKFWSTADTAIQGMVPKEVYEGHLKPRVDGFKAAYGCVLFFEDEADLVVLGEKNPMVAGLVPEWSDHSNGMVGRITASLKKTYSHE
jgi:predicted oxidoreductase (fatty acid repression mutant protein)